MGGTDYNTRKPGLGKTGKEPDIDKEPDTGTGKEPDTDIGLDTGIGLDTAERTSERTVGIPRSA